MKQSGMSSRRHMPVLGPIKLTKSDGHFTPRNILVRKNESADGFTAGKCLAAGSLERTNVRNMTCNIGQCPGGYASYGYEPGETWHYGSGCWMRNMICVKNDYDTNTESVVADCCNGITPQKDCDASLCRGSQTCRDKMLSICDKSSSFLNNNCQTWLNAGENVDMKTEIMPKYCTAESLAGGPCRAFAETSASHGLMDTAVKQWCTPNTIVIPNPVPLLVTQFARWQLLGMAKPVWYDSELASRIRINNTFSDDQYKALLMNMTQRYIQKYGLDAVQNPTPKYRDNSKDPICACYLSPLNKYGDKAAPPSCFDTNCVAGGYQSGGMKTIAQRCPSWSECRSTVTAVAGGTNEKVNVQQICGGPPDPSPTTAVLNPTTPLVPPRDDKERLLEDEKRGGAVPSTTKPPVPASSAQTSWRDQLQKPFAPDLLGDTSIESVAVLFFAVVILSAILWRVWSDKKRQKFQEALQMEQFQQAIQQPLGVGPSEAQMAIRSQMAEMPRVA